MQYTWTTTSLVVILNFLNAVYDYARRLCRRTLETAVKKILGVLRSISKAATESRIDAHGLRKEPETLAPLPLDTSLSSFDDYEIINGTPVFTLKERKLQPERETPRIKKAPRTWDSFADAPNNENNASGSASIQARKSKRSEELPIDQGLSTRREEQRITCYAFSHDDHYFVCGRRDGSVSVWNVQNGSLLRVLRGGHLFSIGDVAFREDELSTLVSVDSHGWCVKWNLESGAFTRMRCAPVWEDPLYVGKEFAVPKLSQDGQYLGFPVYVYVEPGRNTLPDIPTAAECRLSGNRSGSSDEMNGDHTPLTRFYVVGYVYDLDVSPQGETENTNPVLVLPVRIEERLNFEDRMLDLMCFSHSAKRLLMTTYELSRPYLVLWTDAKGRSVESYKLPGTRGCFSQDDRYLVTWYGMTSSKEQFDEHSCYVWDINNLSKVMGNERGVQWNHPYYEATNALILTNPGRGVVHTCGFVRLENHIGIASSSVSDTLKIVIWSLKSADPIHVLDSTFGIGDVASHDARALVRDLGQLDRVPGMKCVSIANNGLWIGAYSPVKRKGIIWNPYLGTEILRMTLPVATVESRAGMDLCFSETTTKMMMVGLSRSLLWDPCVLRSYNSADKPIYTLNSRDGDMGMGETICRFSEDGQAVGLLRAQSFCMDIWHFHPERQFTLNRQDVRVEESTTGNRRRRRTMFELETVKYRFGHFALSPDGYHVVTCMCDMSVLLWNTEELFQCRRIATLSSQYRPALDVCFSWTPANSPTVVICQDQGLFIWISLQTDEIIDMQDSGGIMRCKFTSRGTVGVIMSNLYHVKIWNLVTRVKIKELDYSIPLMRTVRGDFFHEDSRQAPYFHPKLSQDASFALVGFRHDLSPIIAYPNTSPDHLDETIWNPMDVVLSEDGEWAVLMGQIDQDEDDVALSGHGAPDFATPILNEPFPKIVYGEEDDPNPVMAAPHLTEALNAESNQTFKVVHLKGTYTSKQMRLPYNLRTHKFLSVTEDGRKFAALNMRNQLIVWGTHFTYKHVIQQRFEMVETGPNSAPDYIENKLDEYGASLINHPYIEGWTVLMECVMLRKVEMLKRIISWAQRSGIYLSFHGLASSQKCGTGASATNALDLAVNSSAPHIAQIILQALVQGATSETCLSKILEHSLIHLSYKYPTLLLHFFRTSEIMKPLCVISISESFFKSSSGYHGVVTNKRLVASTDYIQHMWTEHKGDTAKTLEIPAEAKVVPLPNIAKIGYEGLLQPLLLQNAQHFVYSTDLVKAVINYKYFEYGRSLLLEDLYHHLMLLVTFTGNCIVVGYEEHCDRACCPNKNGDGTTSTSGPIYTTVFATFVAFGSLIRLIMQVHSLWLEQGWSGLLYYAKNVQKWIELVYCLLLVLAIPITVKRCGFESDTVAALMAITSVLLWVKLLFYAQAFKSTGPMVIMMREIIFDTPTSNLFSGFGGGVFDNFPAFGQDCEEPASGGSDVGSLASQLGIGTGTNPVTDILSSTTSPFGGGVTDILSSITRDRFVPFNVPGGDATANVEEPEQEVEVNPNPNRPEGDWEFLVEAKVSGTASEVWASLKNFGHILLYGLEGLAENFRSLDSKGKRWIIDVRRGENFVLEVTTTNDETFFHIVKIVSHTSDVFPGVDIAGSTFFIQFIPTDDGSTKIEFGWGGTVNGPRDVAKTAVGAFGQELVDNLGDRFGESCESGKNIRTIEGDCNNLNQPKRGAAGHALARMGNGDPAYPSGDPRHPSGPIHISPRAISNKLCAHSPGLGILEDKASALKHECFTDSADDLVWNVCPLKSAVATSGGTVVFSLDWKGFKKHSSGSLLLHFTDGSCDLKIMLVCSGPKVLELFGSVCGVKGHRLYHPEACSVSAGEDQVLNSPMGLTDMFWTFGQFVDHDLDLTPVAQLADNDQPGFSRSSRPSDTEVLPISVPADDFYMQSSEMEFERSVLFKDRKRGLHENQHSAYADLGQLYGVDYLRARALRSFVGGKLKVSDGGLPPYNKIDGHGALRAKVDNAPDAKDRFFAVGDLRGNEQPTLLAMHIVWIREHNKVCDELSHLFPKWTDDRLYQTARAIVIAEYQSILYDEWLPLLLGGNVVPSSAYSYNGGLDPSVTAVFSTAAFRFGHTMVGSYLLKLGPGDRRTATVERVPLRDLFFKPELIEREGIDAFLRGAVWHVAKEVDAHVVDELRNFLFTEHSDRGHMDLVALNIQRGRDMGLPSFNQCRRIFGLPPYKSFHAFIPDEHLAASTSAVYEGDIEAVDLFYGCIAEKHYGSAIVGQTAFTILVDQFRRIRDGDRFFFKALQWDPIILKAYPRINRIMEGKIRLREILLRTTLITPSELGHRPSVFKV